MKELNRIAIFIEGLPMDVTVGNCESALLSTNMDYVGGDNGGNCGGGCKQRGLEAYDSHECTFHYTEKELDGIISDIFENNFLS